eukprot:12932590-Prorocentrum_lima.AAC.1
MMLQCTTGLVEASLGNQNPLPKGTSAKNNTYIDQEQEEDEPSLSSALGAPMGIAFMTRPDICWAVTRVSRAA